MVMKIAIPSSDGKTISFHIGKAKGFLIFEIEDKKIKGKEYRPNTSPCRCGESKGESETEHHKAILEILKDCKAIISCGMGKRIYNDLKKAGIELFIIEETDVDKVLELFLNDKLPCKTEIKCRCKS